MSDDEDKKIIETNNKSQNDTETNSDLQPEMGNTSSDSNHNTENQPKDENNQENKVIHKKEGRLHIYVRQDKYKGELKSKNWVGRLYVNGKQKISSSGTQNLDEAIPILEKWFDDVLLEAQSIQQQNEQKTQEKETKPEVSTQKVENLEEPKKDEPKVVYIITFRLSNESESFPTGHCATAPDIASKKVTIEISKIVKFIDAA